MSNKLSALLCSNNSIERRNAPIFKHLLKVNMQAEVGLTTTNVFKYALRSILQITCLQEQGTICKEIYSLG